MKKSYLIIFLLSVILSLYGSEDIDSLKYKIEHSRKESSAQVMAYYDLGMHYREIAQFDSAYSYLGKALQIAEKRAYDHLLPKIYNGMGTVWYKLSNFDKALQYYKQAVEYGIENDAIGNTNRLLNIGKTYFYQGEYNNALEYFQQAYNNSEKHDDLQGKAHSYKEMAKIYNIWDKYPQAEQYYENALQIYEHLGDKRQISIVLNELGIIARHEKDHQKSIDYQKRSLAIKEEIGYDYGIAASLNGLGITHKTIGDYENALAYYQKALAIQLRIGDDMGAAATISNIGLVYQLMDNNELALRQFMESNRMAEKINYHQLMLNNLKAIANVHSEQNNYEESVQYLNKFIVMKDSVFSEEKHRQFAEMQTRYETVKKDKENEQLKYELELNFLELNRQREQRNMLIIISFIILSSMLIIIILYRMKTKAYQALSKANELIIEQKKELELMNKTRDRFFSIIAHDLKNSLVSTKMGVDLLDDIDKMDRKMSFTVVNELKETTSNLTKLLENLLQWARIQIGRIHLDPQVFTFSEVLEDVLLAMKSRVKQKSITISADIDSTAKVEADKNMVYSILQNILSNAIKFSLPGGEIVIRQKQEGDKLRVFIIDNGIGMSADVLQKIFRVDEIVSMPGTDGERGTGLGLILCKEFIEKNGGEIRIESIKAKGTTVQFTLPLSIGKNQSIQKECL
jgi:signal transduction histidine kinase